MEGCPGWMVGLLGDGQVTRHGGKRADADGTHPRVRVEAAIAAMREGVGERADIAACSFDDESYPDHELAAMIEDIVDAYHGVEPCPHCGGSGRRA